MRSARAKFFFLLSLAASATAARTTLASSSSSAAKKKPSLIVSTDADIDDLLAIAMIVHSPVYNLEAIIVNGNDWTNPIAGVPNILTILQARASEGGLVPVFICLPFSICIMHDASHLFSALSPSMS